MIAVTKASMNYTNWLKANNPGIVLVDMYKMDVATALKKLESCSGIVVTGGEDVQPGMYGKASQTMLCKEMDPRRDTLEIRLIGKAIRMDMPILGICRGEQIINVTLGGTLIVDIPTHFSSMPTIEKRNAGLQHQCEDYLKCFHTVKTTPGSVLQSIVKSDTGFVTSNHHQAIDKIAPELRANATSSDGIIEGIEWVEPEGRSFLMAVQWHPERMDPSNAFSGLVLTEFMNQVKAYHKNKETN
jgi:putative glutamine amidotransferase